MSDEPQRTELVEGENDANQSPEELAKFVETLLGDMQNKFQQMSEQIIGRLDEMGKRVDDLEKNISDLMQQVDSKEESGGGGK
ncbi:PREDICTED: heat shock factor-binding protein 1-like [Amphimedon queenslandica]|uniref:Heat shock factor binding protein 1 n=1 Tax=Amphimedon queenslandica TaxID=400682 RepID=A0A1X7VAZ5_AMPQE|nr:PREDICTED: heat shock factor-binding protein 1-like [Amphimedon queenslandica]|eukprot:XP_011402683.1 PREDICTED: heat shock factor-binding protein 1-like [Amphimedon queenslandica]